MKTYISYTYFSDLDIFATEQRPEIALLEGSFDCQTVHIPDDAISFTIITDKDDTFDPKAGKIDRSKSTTYDILDENVRLITLEEACEQDPLALFQFIAPEWEARSFNRVFNYGGVQNIGVHDNNFVLDRKSRQIVAGPLKNTL